MPAGQAQNTLALTFAGKPQRTAPREGNMDTPTRSTVNTALIGAIVAVATIGGLLFGYDSGAVNGTQQGLTEEFALSSAGLGFTVGSLLIGCAVGAFFAGRLADAIGRNTVPGAATSRKLGR